MRTPARLPLDEQLTALRTVLSRNEVLLEVLHRTATLELPGWYLTAGCLFQTVWNVVTDRPPQAGIKDYDLFYFDDTDLSWDAEDAVIRTGREVFDGLPAEVEIRNEARVHLWYEEKFGVPCAPYASTEAAIDSFAATTCCLGVRLEPDDRWRVYAPHGLSDVFGLVVRPNPVLAPRAVYEAKAARWRAQWPGLTVLEWPSGGGGEGGDGGGAGAAGRSAAG
ncbi:nucleotidyltransferase family protein [Streptomyces sp. T028]|uniref:nucleotidyltransferase family protein n=1 Tax=Streptomyces sp. T028 TaxID=3394379 RepID=UPI003A8724D7